MTNQIIQWASDHLPTGDFLELYFVLSDLVDINLTEQEICERASLDSLASAMMNEKGINPDIPIGKQVF